MFFFFQAEDGIRDYKVTGVQTCALPIPQGLEAVALAGAHGAQGFFIARPPLHGLLDQGGRGEDVLEVLEATEVQDGDELGMALSWSGMERMAAPVAGPARSCGGAGDPERP